MGGFGAYTRTGRNMAMGRSFGEAWARQSAKSSSGENKSEPPVYIWIMIIFVWLILLNKMSKGTTQQQ